MTLDISSAAPQDAERLLSLYSKAFPDEDLTGLVAQLLAWPSGIAHRVIRKDSEIIAHVAVSACAIDGGPHVVSLLGPLAVAPGHQGQGLGRRMIEDSQHCAAAQDAARLCVLGDPGYYGQFGFTADADVIPPYDLPAAWRAAWRSRPVQAERAVSGRMVVPEPWQNAALWQ